MKMKLALAGLLCSLASSPLFAQVPQLIHYQGRLMVSGTNFSGSGQFKFALVGTNLAGATASFWSNDGSSAGGGEPATAAALPVIDGLYSVLLGDASLANMRMIPATVFTNADVRLRIWFGDGATGFDQLAPDQRIAAVGYAMMAGTAATVADGAITTAKLAGGAVTADKLADGAVSATKLAAGSVAATNIAAGAIGPNQLARRYDAGRLDTATSNLQISDAGNADLVVPFHTSFAATPIITFALENTNSATMTPQLALLGKTVTNFTLRLSQFDSFISTVYDKAGKVTINRGSDYGAYSSVSQVNGRPAICFYDKFNKSLLYAQAMDDLGTLWKTPVVLDAGPLADLNTSLLLVSGNPAVVYWSADGNGSPSIQIVRASDTDGQTWGAPVTVVSDDVWRVFSVCLVKDNPAIAFTTADAGILKMVRASNAAGSTWSTPVVVDGSRVCAYPTLKLVQNNPAIAYMDWSAMVLYYIRATDDTGNAWGAPLLLDVGRPINMATGNYSSTAFVHKAGFYASLEIIDGRPAVAYQVLPRHYGTNSAEGRYLRAGDALGTTWGIPRVAAKGWAITAASQDNMAIMGRNMRLSELGGKPYLTFRYFGYWNSNDAAPSEHAACRAANDASGSTWWRFVYPVYDGDSADSSVAVVNGSPACAYYADSQLKFKRIISANAWEWPANAILVKNPQIDLTGLLGQLVLTNGTPLVLFQDPAKGDLKSIKAVNASGTQWSASAQTVDSGGNAGLHTSLAVLPSGVAIAYRDESNRRLKFVLRDAQRWTPPVMVDALDNPDWPSLTSINGTAAIAYLAGGSRLRYVRALSESGSSWQKIIELDGGLTPNATPSLADINGRPAIAYAGMRLRFVGAANTTGTKWNAPVVVLDQATLGASLAVVDNRPAIAFYANGLFFVRANDTNGMAWPTEAKVDVAGNVGEFASLKVINGFPAIAYYDRDHGDLKFVLAGDVDGTSWNSPTTVDSAGDVGRYACLAEADGKPLIAYWAALPAGDLRIVRALDSAGKQWEPPMTVASDGTVGEFASLALTGDQWCVSYYDRSNSELKLARAGSPPETVDGGASVGLYLSAAMIGNYPCVSYYDQDNGRLKFNRATSTGASAWESPRVVDLAGDVGLYSSLADVNGFPAIGYYDRSNHLLKYVRATLASGGAWGAPVIVDGTNNVGAYASLAMVSGRPALAYYDATLGDLKYTRAGDANGATWGVPVTPDPGDVGQDVGRYASLAVVNGRPAIAYYDVRFGELKFIRANDDGGVAWGSYQAIDRSDDVGVYICLRVIAGKPAVSYYNQTSGDLKLIRARDADGRNWNAPIVADSGGGADVGSFAAMSEVNGNPSITYWDNTSGQVKNYYPFKPVQINWFSIEP